MGHGRFTILLALALIPIVLVGCGGGKSSLVKLNPYEGHLAFYGKVIDTSTRESPLYPVTIELLPEDPGNHVVIDSSIFFISDVGLDPAYDYSLKIGAQYYEVKEIPLKFVKGKKQDLGIIEIANVEPRIQGPFTIKPFVEFSPGSGLLEKPGWSISSFLSEWKSVDQPFGVDDVENYVHETLPPGSPEVTPADIRQSIDGWLKDGLIEKYGKNSYILK
jgi:hypothetical protein